MSSPLKINFDKGTLILQDVPEAFLTQLPDLRWDERTLTFRAPAYRYRAIVSQLRARDLSYQDTARQFTPEPFTLQKEMSPHFYQTEAIDAWHANGKRGVVSLPTGAGKTFIAILLISDIQRPTLVHVPTIDLMHQWHTVLTEHFGQEIGLYGGGHHELQDLTAVSYTHLTLPTTPYV